MPEGPRDVRVVGRYVLCDRIAGGGMATVHLGRLLGEAGFSRTVAIKRLHAHLSEDPEFVSMFIDEARLAARIHHPNVVATLDVVARENELFLVMEYVHGESLARLMRAAAERCEPISPRIGGAIVAGFLHGLHAAHEARSERGEPLDIVHRDVSPQNVLVGSDGVARVVDFGVAKAVGRVATTRDGQLKGKLAYMAPEQISGAAVTRRTDLYAAGIVFWELLTGRRLFQGENEAAVVHAVVNASPPPPSSVASVSPAIDRIVMRGLARDPAERFQTAREMALAIEGAIGVALPSEVGAWMQSLAEPALSLRATLLGHIESSARIGMPGDAASASRVAVASGGDSPRYGMSTDPPTMLTASSEAAPPPHKSRRSLVTLGAGAVIGIGGVLLVARLAASTPTARGAVVAAKPPEPPSAASAPPKLAPTPEVADAVEARPVGSALGAPSDATGSRPAASGVPAAQHAVRPVSPAAPPLGTHCDPPYRIDASGRKIFKVECL